MPLLASRLRRQPGPLPPQLVLHGDLTDLGLHAGDLEITFIALPAPQAHLATGEEFLGLLPFAWVMSGLAEEGRGRPG